MLPDAVLDALKPDSFKERLKLRISGGRTAKEVLERLEPALRESLIGPIVGEDVERVVGTRKAIDQIQKTLIELSQQDKLLRSQRSAWVELKSKGHRSVVVDVFRLK
jgi:hypothetical protein